MYVYIHKLLRQQTQSSIFQEKGSLLLNLFSIQLQNCSSQARDISSVRQPKFLVELSSADSFYMHLILKVQFFLSCFLISKLCNTSGITSPWQYIYPNGCLFFFRSFTEIKLDFMCITLKVSMLFLISVGTNDVLLIHVLYIIFSSSIFKISCKKPFQTDEAYCQTNYNSSV